MKVKLISIATVFVIALVAITVYMYTENNEKNDVDNKYEQIVALNEIQQLAHTNDKELFDSKIEELQESLRNEDVKSNNAKLIITMCIICFAFMAVLLGYIYYTVIRPFHKLEVYAGEIAKGNFDMGLKYERTNYFGKFTWAFDSMRREIIKARTCEREAIENNKTVIATLSHDIKTPISSIRAYAEGLEAGLCTTEEKRERYLSTIMRKCDEVSKLTNDLFLHSLSEIDRLKINDEKMDVCSFVADCLDEMSEGKNDINCNDINCSATIMADKNRIAQVIENIINNARKYAKTVVDVWCTYDENNISIHFRDYGKGIPDEDMPFIFDKFYRGRNCSNEQGSGLGLYIIKYLVEKMQGTVLLHNHKDGLEITVSFPILKDN